MALPPRPRRHRHRHGYRHCHGHGHGLQQRHPSDGFSFAEALISSLLFALVGTGTVAMMTLTTRQAGRTRDMQEEQFAISADLASVQSRNDRYTCASGSCGFDLSGDPPGENDYYPLPPAARSTYDQLCRSDQLVDPLVAGIRALPLSDQMLRLGIGRQIAKETGGDAAAHRYTVSWLSRDGSLLRQMSLTPTAASWCP